MKEANKLYLGIILAFDKSNIKSKGQIVGYWFYSLLVHITEDFTNKYKANYFNSINANEYGMSGLGKLSSSALHNQSKYGNDIKLQENLTSNDRVQYANACQAEDIKTQLEIACWAFYVRLKRVVSRTSLSINALETYKFATIYYIAGESKAFEAISMSNGNWQFYESKQIKEWGTSSWTGFPEGYGYKFANMVEKTFDVLRLPVPKPKEEKPKPKTTTIPVSKAGIDPKIFIGLGVLLLLGVVFMKKGKPEPIITKKVIKKKRSKR